MLSTIASYQLISSNMARSLQQTLDKPDVQRETAYFLEHIGDVKSIDAFMANDRLFSYAMKAFGLSDMTYAKAFVRKVLTEGVTSTTSFANKLVDTRYREFATAFDFAAQGEHATAVSASTSGTVEKYLHQMLEEDAGAMDDGVRLALYFARKAPNIKNAYQVLADPALIKVVQTALGISPLTSASNIDKQSAMMTKGFNFADFQDPAKLKKFLQRFSAMWQAENPAESTATAILINQPIEAGTSASTLQSLQNLKIGR